MKKILASILLLSFLTTGCLHHHPHKRDAHFKTRFKKTIKPTIQPQKKEEKIETVKPIPEQEIELPAEPSIEIVPDEIFIPEHEVNLTPGERATEKKESEGWWFWNS